MYRMYVSMFLSHAMRRDHHQRLLGLLKLLPFIRETLSYDSQKQALDNILGLNLSEYKEFRRYIPLLQGYIATIDGCVEKMEVCMYVCTVYMYFCSVLRALVRTYIHTYIHTYIGPPLIQVYTYMYTYIHTYTHAFTYMYLSCSIIGS